MRAVVLAMLIVACVLVAAVYFVVGPLRNAIPVRSDGTIMLPAQPPR